MFHAIFTLLVQINKIRQFSFLCREGPLVNLLVFSLFLRVPCGLYMLRSITLAMYQNMTSPLSYSNSRSFPHRIRKIQPCQHVNIAFSIMNTLFMQYTTSNALKHLTDLIQVQNRVGLDRNKSQTEICGLCRTRQLGNRWSKFWSPSRKNGHKCDWASANFTPWMGR